MARLIVLKCEKDNDLINLIDSALEDGIGFSVDQENNTFFTSDLELITNDIRNISKLLTNETSIYYRWFWWYHIGYMPIWNGGNFKIDVRHKIRPYISRRIDGLLNNSMLNYLKLKRSTGICKISLEDTSGNRLFPDLFQVFIDFGSKPASLFYKVGELPSECPIDLYSEHPLFADKHTFWGFPGKQELIIRDALKHLLNFSYPGEKSGG